MSILERFENQKLIKKWNLISKKYSSAPVLCQTGGKPSTRFPPGGLVEQSTDKKQNNKDEDEDEDEDESDGDGDRDRDRDRDEDDDRDGDEDEDEDRVQMKTQNGEKETKMRTGD